MAKNNYNRAMLPMVEIVAKTAAAGLVPNNVLRISTVGDGTLPGLDKALATAAGNVDGPLAVLLSETDGGAAPASGDVVRVLCMGLLQGVPLAGDPNPLVGDPVYVSDAGALRVSAASATVKRIVGEVLAVSAGVSFDCWFNGLAAAGGGGSGVPAPADAPYLTDGAVAGLTAEKNVQALAATLAFIASNDAVTPLAVRRFSAGSTARSFVVQDHTGTALAGFQADGDLDLVAVGRKTVWPGYQILETADGWEVQGSNDVPLFRVTAAGATVGRPGGVVDQASEVRFEAGTGTNNLAARVKLVKIDGTTGKLLIDSVFGLAKVHIDRVELDLDDDMRFFGDVLDLDAAVVQKITKSGAGGLKVGTEAAGGTLVIRVGGVDLFVLDDTAESGAGSLAGVGSPRVLGPNVDLKTRHLDTTGRWQPTNVSKAFADSPYATAATDQIIFYDATGGLCDVNLPAASAGKRRICVCKVDTSANRVRVNCVGADTIGSTGVASYDLTAPDASVELASNGGSKWFFVRG